MPTIGDFTKTQFDVRISVAPDAEPALAARRRHRRAAVEDWPSEERRRPRRRGRTQNDFLRTRLRAAADADTVLAALHFQFGDSALVDYLDQLFDFFDSHFRMLAVNNAAA